MSALFPNLGVAIVSYNSSDVILDCLESLLAIHDVALHIVIVDNASPDDTVMRIKDWSLDRRRYQIPFGCPFELRPRDLQGIIPLDGTQIIGCPHKLQLVQADFNGGFAAGVNAALSVLQKDNSLDRFWILNPDSMVPPGTAHAFATAPEPAGGFSLMGGRVLYFDQPDRIQIDGGIISWRSGATKNLNQFALHTSTPAANTKQMDFITGASMVASRKFYEAVGPMREEYFLYYEEVDWALRRGSLPLAYCADGIVFHKAGTAIGSPKPGQPASAFSIYFKHRARLMFIREFSPWSLSGALLFSVAKAGQLLLQGFPKEAGALLMASFGFRPPAGIRSRLSKEALQRIS